MVDLTTPLFLGVFSTGGFRLFGKSLYFYISHLPREFLRNIFEKNHFDF